MDLNIAVQLYMDGQPLGVLRADAERLEAFRQYELRLLDTGAGWVGTLTYRPDIADSFQPGSYQEGELSPAEQLVTIIAHDLRNYLTPLLGRIGYIGRQAAQDTTPVHRGAACPNRPLLSTRNGRSRARDEGRSRRRLERRSDAI